MQGSAVQAGILPFKLIDLVHRILGKKESVVILAFSFKIQVQQMAWAFFRLKCFSEPKYFHKYA